MYLVAIAWLYVVLLMALAEGVSDHGTWLGAAVTLAFYGLLPLAVVLYLVGTPSRRAARQAREAASAAVGDEGDAGRHSAGDPVATEGKET